ncbi:hypothetical protein [Catenulispora subtropica]|uniref:Uncharacterized protein n=1 Tax=Catenulispora subtropica TaxID=450798 RepID=A0ABP5CDJ2_9ACTN
MVIVAGLIDALHYAGWDDVPTVLGALGDAELAAGVASAALPIGVAVSDFVLARAADGGGTGAVEDKGSAALLALTRRALADETVADPDAVLRALIRLADPAVDELLFRDDLAPRPRDWVLRAVLRDRRGADGRPMIAPGVDRFVRRQVHRIERRLAGYDHPHPARIERLLLDAALFADDPDLAAFALPLGIRLRSLTGVARALQTLRDHRRLDDVWTGGLRAMVAEAASDDSQYRYSQWQAVLLLGDEGTSANLRYLLQRSQSNALPPPADDADRWTAPNVASQHYDLDWDSVLSFAKVLGDGDEGTQAAQMTSRGLDEASAREDIPESARVLLEEHYPRAVYWTARPGVAAVICAAVDTRELNPPARHFGLRELLRRGLLHGSLSARDVMEYAAPASAVLALATPVPPGLTEYYTAKGDNSFAPHNSRIPSEAEERYQADLRAAAAEAIGPDPARWLKVLTRVGAWEDSLTELVRAVDDGVGLPARRADRWPRGVDPAAVLLEIAPEGVVDRLLAAAAVAGGPADGAERPAASPDRETRALLGVLTRILDRGPVPRRLLDHALGPHGTPAMRLAAARNPAATGGTLWRLADREPAEPQVLAAVYLHPLASRELRVAAVVRSEAAGGLYPGLIRRLVTRDAEPGLLLPALESRSPEVLHTVLRRGGRVIETDRRIAAYARLAEAAGPEPVWALELERAGSLERMHDAVRASMAAHDDAPLQAAAAGVETRHPERVTRAWDAAFHPTRPDTAERVRALLDGHPGRWLRMLETGASLYGLLDELEAGAAL